MRKFIHAQIRVLDESTQMVARLETDKSSWLPESYFTNCTIIQCFLVVNGDAALQMLGNLNTMLQNFAVYVVALHIGFP